MYRSLPALVTVSILIACSPSKPAPVKDAPEFSESQGETNLQRPRRPVDPQKLFADYDKCTRFKYCKALDHLNLYFSSQQTAKNYGLLIRALTDTSPRIQAFALFRLFSFKDRPDLVPHLTGIMERSQDKTVLKMALSLLFLNGSKASTEYITAHWADYPRSLKLEVVWVIRKVASHLPMGFMETLASEQLPALRALSLEVGVRLSSNVDQLMSCVKAMDGQSGFCALSLVRFTEKDIPDRLVALFDHFHALASKQRRLLRAPSELVEALEKLSVQGRIERRRAFETALKTLKDRKLDDRIRARAALFIGSLGGRDARMALERFRKDRRRRVGHATRRAIYLLEKTPG